ncbi:MAG: 1-(5-phosphoribosyl)-5-[(5-phosphoribosylamino)methylideneamino]imidazole-4-carboxamide isomerase [bacterium]|nr:1-(5-phosphoribosyl)-5-[(5-phosphoribosylamino)methylideneamino]imidazole-4-carboxamide isomerase [bacterium]
MIIYPAIDLRGGSVVRLKEGDPQRQTTFSDDPVATAKRWQDEGASWIHVVNLDGAFADNQSAAAANVRTLEQIAKLNVNVQFAGGLRSLEALQEALDRGAARVVIGTAAIQQPELVAQAVDRFGAERVCVALDAREGKIATHGWREISELTPIEYGRKIAEQGITYALYTDVQRDGSLIGGNVHETITLARETGLQVIASGGISTMAEIHQLVRSRVVGGAVIGMALYEGRLTLAEALLAARTS